MSKEIRSGYLQGYLQRDQDVQPILPLMLLLWSVDVILVPLLFVEPIARLYTDLFLPPVLLLHVFAVWLLYDKERKELHTLFHGLYGLLVIYGIFVLEQKFNYYFYEVPFPLYSVVSLIWYAGGIALIFRRHVRRAYESSTYSRGQAFDVFSSQGMKMYIGAGLAAQIALMWWVSDIGIGLVLDVLWGIGFLMTEVFVEVYRFRLMRQYPQYVRFGRKHPAAAKPKGDESVNNRLQAIQKRINNAYEPMSQRAAIVGMLMLLDLTWLPVVFWAPFTYFYVWLTVPALVCLHVYGILMYATVDQQRVGARLFQGVFWAVASVGYLILTMKLVYDLQGLGTLWYFYLVVIAYVVMWFRAWREERDPEKQPSPANKYIAYAFLAVFLLHGALGYWFFGWFAGVFLLLAFFLQTVSIANFNEYRWMGQYPEMLTAGGKKRSVVSK